MRKLLIPIIITLLLTISNNTFAQFGGGTGTAGNPYLINNRTQLNYFSSEINGSNSANYINKYFKITTNINVNTITPIGTAIKSFQGHLDGGGYTLSNVNISSSTYVGIFGYISGATIKNVKIGSGSNISSATNGYTGALVGYAVNSTIDNCNTIVTPSGNSGCSLGGLIGYAKDCIISNCSNTSTSSINSSNSNYGGIVGYANNTTFNSCYSTARMEGNSNSKIGGLIGYATNNCIINECYSTVIFNNVNGYIGGLIGHSSGSQIYKSYSTPSITRSDNSNRIGGLIGSADSTIINNCYSKASFSSMNGSGYTGGLIGYIGNGTTISNSYSAPSGLGTITNSGFLYGYCTSNCFTNSYYLSGGNTQTYGTLRTEVQMKLQPFAIELNACQNQTWKSVTSNYPILYWQAGGNTLPRCLDGSGTEADPFRIRCVADLVTLSNNVTGGTTYSSNFLLVENEIDFNNDTTGTSSDFSPIGNSTNTFQGKFNGGGNIISNLTITSGSYVGLFGNIVNAKIDSLGIEGFNITTAENNGYAGSLVGYASNSEINWCYSVNSTINGNRQSLNDIYIGGLVGYLNGTSKINNSYSRSSLEALNDNGWFFRDFISYVGGLVAYISGGSTISNSYSAPQSLGTKGTRRAFYASGTVTTVNSYYDNANTNNNNTGLTSKSSSEMKSGCFVVSLNNSQSPIVWFKAKSGVNSGYPVLSWQKLSDNITPAGFEGNCLSVSVNDGHQTNPYKVKYVKDLIYISNMVANDTTYNENGNKKYFQMLNDISFIKYDNINTVIVDSSNLYTAIGNFTNNKPFSGSFSGNRFALANYSFSDVTKDNFGLFGYIKNATIKDLGISNINIRAKDNVGGLVGNMDASSAIEACFVYGYINGVSNVGGLVGNSRTASCSILKSFSNTTIDAQTNVGGLVGNHSGGAISNSYSNSEIYSSTYGNNYVGGIIGLANSASNLTNVYSTCKIIRNGTNTNFGKIKGNNIGSNTNCYSRDSVFVNYTNITPSGYNETAMTNADLRNSSFITTLGGSTYWKADYSSGNINDGYPILSYQLSPVILSVTGSLQSNLGGALPIASQVVIIPSGKQLKIDLASSPMCPYIIIEKGGELYNNTDISLFGEQRRELVLGKWNFIGITTNNPTMSFLYNYSDIPYKTFVKQFDPSINNWATTTIQNNNAQLNYNTGFLVMPNYSLDAQQLTTSKIASKGVLYNTNTSSKTFTNDATKLVPLANSYNANLSINQFITSNPTKIQGGIVYALNANCRDWNNNLNSATLITNINPSEGFFVFATNANSSIDFSRSQLISSAKKVAFKELMYVKVKTNDITREAFIEFNEDSENGFDVEDGLMLFGTNEDIVEPYFKKEDNEILKDAFSSLPYSTELNLRSYSANNINLEFSNIPKDIKVYLIDSLVRKVQELNSNPLYNLDISEGNNDNRLKILFTNNEKDIVNYFNTDELDKIQIWNSNSIININGIGLNSFEVYDIMGQKILQQVITSDEYQTNLNLKSGIYIIKAYSQTSISSRKISICR
ncbi:MAG: filamentous hemagglutinin family outer membrane protein [Bacteroidetes bacterium]|nr:filamentous hemagglutinin family outer membrane protein [Bacteroidota bacterium]